MRYAKKAISFKLSTHLHCALPDSASALFDIQGSPQNGAGLLRLTPPSPLDDCSSHRSITEKSSCFDPNLRIKFG